jgi:hypothetical protein
MAYGNEKSVAPAPIGRQPSPREPAFNPSDTNKPHLHAAIANWS